MPSPSGEGLLQKAPEGVPEVIFGVIFEVIFGVILDTIGAIKSRFRVDDARVTKLINAFMNYELFACFSFAFSHFAHFFVFFALVALTILHCPVCRRGGLADDGKRASHARDVR